MHDTPATAQSVLAFWRDLEVFNIPTPPSHRDSTEQVKIDTFRRGDALPWNHPGFTPTETHGYVHVVYVGVADTEDLSGLLLRAMFPRRALTERERARSPGNGWLAAFVVDELGQPKSDSYLAASFAHGVEALRETGSLDNVNVRLERAREEFAQRCHVLEDAEADETRTRNGNPEIPTVDWDKLDDELRRVRQLLGDAADDRAIDWRVVVRSSRVKRRYLADSLQAATDFLNSFFLDDLDRLIDRTRRNLPFGKALATYLGTALGESRRIDILEQHASMTELVAATRLPSARWPAPSRHPLVLAQQAAVATVLHTLAPASGLIGVNGPRVRERRRCCAT